MKSALKCSYTTKCWHCWYKERKCPYASTFSVHLGFYVHFHDQTWDCKWTCQPCRSFMQFDSGAVLIIKRTKQVFVPFRWALSVTHGGQQILINLTLAPHIRRRWINAAANFFYKISEFLCNGISVQLQRKFAPSFVPRLESNPRSNLPFLPKCLHWNCLSKKIFFPDYIISLTWTSA